MVTVAVESALVAALAAGIAVALRKELIPEGAGIKLRKPQDQQHPCLGVGNVQRGGDWRVKSGVVTQVSGEAAMGLETLVSIGEIKGMLCLPRKLQNPVSKSAI